MVHRLFKYLIILFVLIILYIVGFFPWSIQSKFAKLLSLLTVFTRRWRVIIKNYELCFPEWNEQQRRAMALKQCHHVFCMPLVILNAFHRPSIITSQVREVRGVEHLIQANKNKQGCVLLGAHFTAMDFAARYLCQRHNIGAVYQKGEEGLINHFMLSARRKVNSVIIDKKDTHKMISYLRSGNNLWYASDQSYGGTMKAEVDFFGHKVNALTGIERIAKLGKAKILFMSYYYEKNKGYTIEIHSPYENYNKFSALENCQNYMNFVEKYAKLYPDQYYWVHRRFKSEDTSY